MRKMYGQSWDERMSGLMVIYSGYILQYRIINDCQRRMQRIYALQATRVGSQVINSAIPSGVNLWAAHQRLGLSRITL